jgi:hypothetical protein
LDSVIIAKTPWECSSWRKLLRFKILGQLAENMSRWDDKTLPEKVALENSYENMILLIAAKFWFWLKKIVRLGS